jgi:hypothetical protein
LVLILLFANPAQAQEASSEHFKPDVQQELPAAIPEIADIIPFAAKLSARLASLEIRMGDGLNFALLEDDRFLARLGWVVVIQVSLSLIVMFVFYRKRNALSDSPRWPFLTAHPVAAGLTLGVMVTALPYEYGGTPGTWKLANALIGGIALIRQSVSVYVFTQSCTSHYE